MSDFERLPLNRWVSADTNQLDNVVPTPRYPTFLGHPDGSRNIINAWSGAAWDYINQRMFLSGGGHADSHFCENGIYELSVDTLRFSVAMPRSAQGAAQYWDATRKEFVPGMQGGGGGGPLADGSVPSSHTYDTLVWIPPNIVGNTRGAVLMYHLCVGVVDLDTRTYDTAHFDDGPSVDFSYKIAEMDGWNMVHPRASFYYRRWDLRPSTRSATRWSPNSRGAFLGQFSSGANVVYNHKTMVRMPHRREFVMLSGSVNTRCRYGRAFDSGRRDDWAEFHDRITLTSADGSHLVFGDASQWLDASSDTPMFAAGGTYDYWGNCIWFQTNLEGGELYKITGLDGNVWTTQRVAGATALSTSPNGTYHRCQVATKGAARCLVRVSSTTLNPEVCRIA